MLVAKIINKYNIITLIAIQTPSGSRPESRQKYIREWICGNGEGCGAATLISPTLVIAKCQMVISLREVRFCTTLLAFLVPSWSAPIVEKLTSLLTAPHWGAAIVELENVTIAIALQLEEIRRHAVLIRLISSPVPSWNSLCVSLAALERLYCLYVTIRCDLKL